MVDKDKILTDPHGQVGNGLMQAHGMEVPLFGIGDQTLHIFQGAGHMGLAMAFQDRYIDQKIKGIHTVADTQLQTGTVLFMEFVFLGVQQGNPVSGGQGVIAADLEGFGSGIPDPGAFRDHQVVEAARLQIFDDTCHYLRMGRGAPGSL